MRRVCRFCFLLPLLLMGWLHAGPLDEALRRIPTESLKLGYGICLFNTTGEIWSHCEGFAKEETNVPFSMDAVLRLGATSELFTVALALQQIDAGRLDPEQPVATYLPEVFAEAAAGGSLEKIGRLKVRLLMSHLSGTDANFFLSFRDYDPFVNIKTYLQGEILKFPPEAKYVRSGAMVDLLGLALEKTSGKAFEDLAQENLFAPLGMTSASFRYRDSPLFASLRYKSAAPDSYATRIPGFREAVAPCGSMQSSLRDLTRFYSEILRAMADTGNSVLSHQACVAMLSTQDEAAARHQGLRAGYLWKLTLPELAYLGPVAWYSGKFLSHRNVVILLPDLGIGILCATNAWHIIDRDTILPLAIEVIKAYARENLHLPEPELPALHPKVIPASMKTRVTGVFASTSGIYRVDAKRDAIQVSSDTVDAMLVYTGNNLFRSDSRVEAIFAAPGSLSFTLRSGARIEAEKVRRLSAHRDWLKLNGTYRLASPATGVLYAFTLGSFDDVPVISGDDGVKFLLDPGPAGEAAIRCDEASRFFGLKLQLTASGELRLGGIVYRRSN
jgi:CubicO group peptidase (beta-lactamase class C family)